MLTERQLYPFRFFGLEPEVVLKIREVRVVVVVLNLAKKSSDKTLGIL